MAIDRRGFLKSGAAGLAVATAGCALPHPGADAKPRGESAFRHGVASGDPLSDRVILWTRVSPESDALGASIAISWWVARDEAGSDIAGEGEATAVADRDYTIKIDVDGLVAGEAYYYGFRVDGTGDRSPTGRTRTLPPSGVERVRLAFASCANYPAGFFNGYAHLATRDDLDAVLHLGDYIYEYANGQYGDGTELGRIPDPDRETVSLEDYRRRHANYKADPDLQAAHARHPWITIWDDHESANNSHLRGAENHTEAEEGDWRSRRLAAIRAYYEWMPIRELPTGLFRTFRFGELLDLIMLDTRLHGRDPIAEQTVEAASDKSRSLLGEDQTQWLLGALSDSKAAGSKWRVIGQQVIVSPVGYDATGFNADAWDGYRANRNQVLSHLENESIEDVVFLTGDVHSTWVFDVPGPSAAGYDASTGEGAIAVEYVTPAISSPPIGRSQKTMDRLAVVPEHTPHLVHNELTEQGYAVLELTAEAASASYFYTKPAEERSAEARLASTFVCRAGSHHSVRLDEGDGIG